MNLLHRRKASFFIPLIVLSLVRAAIAQDFSFTIEPSSLKLVAGQTASFVVSLTPLDGFTNQVTLSVSNLPSGITSMFSPQTVTPPGTSLLTLSATATEETNSFMLDLIAVGGGITNIGTGSVSVVIGLLPTCYGAFQGTVTDLSTGLPVTNATVFTGGYSAVTDSNGHYLITHLPLSGQDNLPVDYGVTAEHTGYWDGSTEAYAVCDATNTVNLQMDPQETGSITGTVTSSEGGAPVTNATVDAESGIFYSTETDTNGAYQFPAVGLGNDNTPASYSVETAPAGYWPAYASTIVQAKSNSVVNLVVVPVCRVAVTGKVIYGDTGLPATNLYVSIGTSGSFSGITDSTGTYTVTNITLGNNNTPITASITASAPGYYTGFTNLPLSGCGAGGGGPLSAPTIVLSLIPPPPQQNYGAVTGHVYDLQTDLPITNANVSGHAVDSTGAYLITNFYVGSGSITNSLISVYGTSPGYFESVSNVEVYANETSTQDLYLLRIGYGYVKGTVLNSSTGLPVAGVEVEVGGYEHVTAANGEYASGPIQLNPGNAPAYVGIVAQQTGYWISYTNTTVTNGITNIVNIDIIQVCTGATIFGSVVDALTQQPITNATVTDYGPYQAVMTDSNGNFILTNITVGNNNSPIQTTLTASAPGFNSQSKTLTIFCNATISTEFGAPETVFGAIDGYVTNALTGAPLTNVFIGSSFGAATYTDTNGYYILLQAPLGANGANRAWTVTAGPATIDGTAYPAQTKSVVVSANTTNLLSFGFGLRTDLTVSGTPAPDPVFVGSNLLYTITLTNSGLDAANVVLADTLPPNVTFVDASVTNNPGGEFSVPVLDNGVVSITATNFSANSAVVLLINVTPTVAGILTNAADVTSDTPDNSTNQSTVILDTAVAPPHTYLVVSGTPNPSPVMVGADLLYTITLTNSAAAAANVVLADTLPPDVTFVNASISNNPGGVFSAPVLNNGVVSIAAADFASNSVVVLLITVKPTAAGVLTNLAAVTSDTPDPSTNQNTIILDTAVAPLYADLGLTMTNSPNPVLVSNQLTYTLYVTNFGPDNAPGVVLTDTLPANVTFGSAMVSQGGYSLIPGGLQWNIGALGDLASASATIVIMPLATGEVTNTATVAITPAMPPVTDTNLANNTATVVAGVIQMTLTNIALVAGPITFNPQTGLFQQSIQVSNLSSFAASAVRVAVLDLPQGVELYNARGTANGAPYVEYDQPVAAGGNVVFLLEYYESSRQPFTSTNFVATVVAAVVVPPPTGTFLQLDRTPFLSEGQLTIEFASVPGHTYVVQYSSDMQIWSTAAPPIEATNTLTQWTDSGPPETASLPGTPGQRFYRIVQTH